MEKDVFDEVVADTKMLEAMETIEKSETSQNKIPAYTSPLWQDYILNDYLRDDEKFDGLPTNAGLRRAAEDLLGIDEIHCTIISAPAEANSYTAVAQCSILLSSGKRYSDCADACNGNTDAVYRKYPVAIATTRAENRALRKALRLSIVSKDEVSEVANEDRNSGSENPFRITDSQIKVIETLSKRAKINVAKLIESTNTDGEKGELELNKLGYEKAVSLIKLVNEYVQAPQKIPTDLLITQEKK